MGLRSTRIKVKEKVSTTAVKCHFVIKTSVRYGKVKNVSKTKRGSHVTSGQLRKPTC